MIFTATGKRYYWIKLKESFMSSDVIDYLMSQKDGANYVVLYEMLCLKTINTEGKLCKQVGEIIIPYDVDKIQRDCKWFSADTIRVALNLYKAFGLIYEDNDGILVMAEHKNLVGSETDWSVQKRMQQEKKRLLEQGKEEDVESDVENFRTDNRDKDIRDKENRDKDIDNKNNDSIYQAEFEELWQKYPNKKGKEMALKAYIKARKSGVSRETIEQGIENYAEYCRNKEKQYIKHGSTWFNQKSWQDEYTAENKPVKKSAFDVLRELCEEAENEEAGNIDGVSFDMFELPEYKG